MQKKKKPFKHNIVKLGCMRMLRKLIINMKFHISDVLTLSSPGFFGSSQPGGGGAQSALYHNFFVIGRIMMKLGKFVKCFKLYLMMGFWCVNWLGHHNDIIVYGISV